MILYIGKRRKDGRIPATYTFDNGRKINKLISPEEAQAQKGEGVTVLNSGNAGRIKNW